MVKKLGTLILPIAAILLSATGILISVINASDQNRKWAALNVPDIELNDMKMQPFKNLLRSKFDSEKFDYVPMYVSLDDTTLLLDVLTAKDSLSGKIRKVAFSLKEIKKGIGENNLNVGIYRNLRPSFLFQNLGQLPASDLTIIAEAKALGKNWTPLNTALVTKRLSNNMRTAIFGSIFLPLRNPAPDSINFRIYIQYNDQFGKVYHDTIYTRWQSLDNQFYNTTFGE
jgi:hypothetical protein